MRNRIPSATLPLCRRVIAHRRGRGVGLWPVAAVPGADAEEW